MLELLLLRHAKSSWSEPGLADIDRPLAARGRKAAHAIGRYLAANRLAPELVLCSPARRARDTLDIVAEEFKSNPRRLIEPDIYDFGGGEKLLAALRRLGDSAAAVLIVGHNPAIEGLARKLVASGDRALRARLERKYPTAALALIAIAAETWQEAAYGQGTLKRFVRPKDILGEGD
jgi:phosphohistidine phosphatase